MDLIFHYLIYVISGLGLGLFVSGLTPTMRKFSPLIFISGTLAIALLIFLFHVGAGASLVYSSYLVFALSSFYFLRYFRRLEVSYLNVSFFLFLILIPVFILSLNSPYQVNTWDEFSHWVTMPKQMFYGQSLQSNNFLMKSSITYTPGSPNT